MKPFKLSNLLAVVFIGITLSYPAIAEEGADLPPPPEAADMPPLPDDVSAETTPELPPPADLVAPEAEMTAELPPQDPNAVEPPTDENFPPLPEETPVAETQVPEMEPEPTPPVSKPEPELFSSRTELMDMGMEDRLKTKELVLWLYFGGSYGTASAKGLADTSSTSGTGSPGGMGYNAGLGWMTSDHFQMGLDFLGTPRTTTTTVDSAMIGFGPRLGFISIMAMIGSQNGENLQTGIKNVLFSYGLKGGIDIILGHSKDSRVSYGLSPEVYYFTPQAEIGGYNQVGGTVSFRIYGYENAF